MFMCISCNAVFHNKAELQSDYGLQAGIVEIRAQGALRRRPPVGSRPAARKGIGWPEASTHDRALLRLKEVIDVDFRWHVRPAPESTPYLN
jgi:hypothetical protein